MLVGNNVTTFNQTHRKSLCWMNAFHGETNDS
jgi:hypothetical protein